MKKSGFTLIELLASLAIISLLVLVGSQIFGQSLKISRKSYQDEMIHKEAAYAMAFVENNIRSAYKIEILEGVSDISNIKTYTRSYDGKSISSHIFTLSRPDESGDIYLETITDNISNKSEGVGRIRIARISSISLTYDPTGETVHIVINETSQSFRYEALIKVGKRL